MATATDVENALLAAIEGLIYLDKEDYDDTDTILSEGFGDEISNVSSYSETLVTRDNGVVIDLQNGTRICLTIQVNSGIPIP
jgi:hypothetical protein